MSDTRDTSASLMTDAGKVLEDWRPEEADFWQNRGHVIAQRNLWISIPCLLLAFAVWMVWSAVAVRLNEVGFSFTTNELFWLTALPGLSGATLRIFYSFMVPIFGGRRWTAISTAALALPVFWMGIAVQDPSTPFWEFLIIALLCGFGGGNFASSMANISFFFPAHSQGTALGLNAGLGNLGVSVMQLVVPFVITTGALSFMFGSAQVANGTSFWLQNAGFVWVPFIALFTVLAWLGMNDIASARSSFREQATIFRRKHQWTMSWLYIATFGSFIGYSAAFPMLTKTQFPGIDPLQYAFLGPLVGALTRPLGGWLADRMGGARVTFWNYVVMIAAVFGVVQFLPIGETAGHFGGFFAMFMILFVTTGIGNGSTFRMIPVIFRTQHERWAQADGTDHDEALKNARRESAATLGFSSALAAYGAFFIPKAYGTSIAMTGGPTAALYAFALYYLTCVAVTWWLYYRRGAEIPC